MSCHTYFYKRIEKQPSWEDVKQQVLKNWIGNIIRLHQQMIDNTLKEKIKEAYPEWTKEVGLKYMPILKRTERMIQSNLCKNAVCYRYEHNEQLTIFLNNIFYYTNKELPSNIFRIGTYPEDILLSPQETAKFINKNRKMIKFCNNWKTELKDFWNNNPDGLIIFG